MMFPGFKWLLILLLVRHTETDTEPERMENIEAKPERMENIEASFAVIGSIEPLSVEVGGTATLRCRLDSPRSAASMFIRFHRSDDTHVFKYHNKSYDNGAQDSRYQGRTTFTKDNISDGIVELQIHNISYTDEDNYTCFFHSSSFFNHSDMELKVTEKLQEDRKNETTKQKGKTEETDHSCSSVWYKCIPCTAVSTALFVIVVIFIYTKKCKQGAKGEDEEEARGGAEVKGTVNQKCQNERESLLQNDGRDAESQNRQNERESRLQKDGPAPFTELTFILEKDTSSNHLDISSDQKSVKLKGDTMLDTTVKRGQPVIFGKDGFTKGKYVWKVIVGEANLWAVGVAEKLARTVNSNLLEEERVWGMGLTAGQFKAFTSPLTNLSLDPHPKTLVVYLDIGGGQLSFYNAENQRHIYTYMICFHEKVFPFIWTMDQNNWITVCDID